MTAAAAAWFEPWTANVMETNPSDEWAAPDSQFWVELAALVEEERISEDEARRALSLMFGRVRFPGQLAGELRDAVAKLRSDAAQAAVRTQGVLPGTLEEARRKSIGCPDCGGEGTTSRRLEVREVRANNTLGDASERTVGLACVCAAGRWILRGWLAATPPTRALDLAEWPALWLEGGWHPTWPVPDPHAAGQLPDLRDRAGRRVAVMAVLDNQAGPSDREVDAHWSRLTGAEQQSWIDHAEAVLPGLAEASRRRPGLFEFVFATARCEAWAHHQGRPLAPHRLMSQDERPTPTPGSLGAVLAGGLAREGGER